MMRDARKVLYLSLDGTVRKGPQELGHPILSIEDLEILPGVPDLLARYKEDGWLIAGLVNHGEVALGMLTSEDMGEVEMHSHLLCGEMFDKILICQHHPDADDPEYARCWCRIPRIGLVVEGARDLSILNDGDHFPPHLALFVGATEEDRLCAEAANIDFRWARDWRAEIDQEGSS